MEITLQEILDKVSNGRAFLPTSSRKMVLNVQ